MCVCARTRARVCPDDRIRPFGVFNGTQRPNSVHEAVPLGSFQEDQIEGHTQTGERHGNVKPGPDYRRCEGVKRQNNNQVIRQEHNNKEVLKSF